MLKKKNHHTYNQAACICIAACLLFLSALTACSSEPEPEVIDEEWVPLEINIASIEKMEVSPMSKAGTTELPDIVRMEFREGDALVLYISGEGSTYVFLQSDGTWKKLDGTSLMLRPNTNYTIFAEYGTELGYESFGTTDCLQSEDATPVYDESTKTYTCSFNFTRPELYSCLKIEFDIMDPGDPIEEDANGHVYVTFTNATLITDWARDPDPFPIINNCLETFYRGDRGFIVRGVVLERSHRQGEVRLERFDSENDSYSFTVTPGHITNVLLKYPYPVWEIPNN
ncbi:hypothetical protein [uncultured Parabacteroides sp.]|uniref:hypothetical protein n=1 Tax=uncultured Parabacteroides sp. TaxID=512312 RepID=UPI0025E9CE75|nr:hypothetical protein [uncultured Parabacteroides sp.]